MERSTGLYCERYAGCQRPKQSKYFARGSSIQSGEINKLRDRSSFRRNFVGLRDVQLDQRFHVIAKIQNMSLIGEFPHLNPNGPC